jgi:hypothetical protein
VDRAGIAVVRQGVEMPARGPTDERDDVALVHAGDLADGRDPEGPQLASCDGADTPERLDGERVEECELAVGGHDE